MEEPSRGKYGQGSPSPRRLEDYDQIKTRLDEVTLKLTEALTELDVLRQNKGTP